METSTLFSSFVICIGISPVLINAVESAGDDPLEWLRTSIPGEPGVDYPILSQVQETSFSCEGLVFGGYYADQDMSCQGYHVCLQDGLNPSLLFPASFLCPNGTIFNMETFVCDWWFNVDCGAALSFYPGVEGAFGQFGEDDAGACPAPSLGGSQCDGAVSNCWSPGQRDSDCPFNGLCCFDGCADTCVDGPKPTARPKPQSSPRPKPQPTPRPNSTSRPRPNPTSRPRPQTTRRPQTTPRPRPIAPVVAETESSRQPQTEVTTYRPVFTSPLPIRTTTGYQYSPPPPEVQLIPLRPQTPRPELPTLYGPPSLGKSRRKGRKQRRRNF